MGLKIKPEIQIQYSSVLEAQIVLDIATKLMGYTLQWDFRTHFYELTLAAHTNSRSIRIRLQDGDIRLVHQPGYQGIKLNFQQFIAYAAKQ